MNEYEFYYEINKSGWFCVYRTSAVNTLVAYEDFIVYLRENKIDPAIVEVLEFWTSECNKEEENDGQ